MSFYSLIEDNLYDATFNSLSVIGYPDVKVIFSHKNIREPSGTYCLITIIRVRQEGYKDEATFLTDHNPTTSKAFLQSISHYKILVQFSFIGRDADKVSFDFRHNVINNRACRDEWLKMNFGFLEKSDLRRNPQARETQWVDEFKMDIEMSFAVSTKQEYDWVDTVEVDKTYTDNNTDSINEVQIIPDLHP